MKSDGRQKGERKRKTKRKRNKENRMEKKTTTKNRIIIIRKKKQHRTPTIKKEKIFPVKKFPLLLKLMIPGF